MSINFKKIVIVLATSMMFSSGFVSNVIGMENMDNSSIVCLEEVKKIITHIRPIIRTNNKVYSGYVSTQLGNAVVFIRSVINFCTNGGILKQVADIVEDLKSVKNECEKAGFKCSSLEDFIEVYEVYCGK